MKVLMLKHPAQRAATVESVSASDFKAVAAAQGDEGSKGGDRNGCGQILMIIKTSLS